MSAEAELLAFWRRQLKDTRRHAVVLIEIAAIFALHGSQRQARLQYNMIRELAERHNGKFFSLAKGDVAVAVRQTAVQALVAELHDWVLRDAHVPEDAIRRRVTTYELPAQMSELRDMIARYLQDSGAPGQSGLALLLGQAEGPDTPLKGLLTPGMMERIEHRVMRSDIRPFVHRQTIFERPKGESGPWKPRIQERRIGLARLRETLFPQLEIASTNPLFGQLCRILDERLLHHFMMGQSQLHQTVSINVSIATIFDRIFDMFLAHLDATQRAYLMIEVNCGDIFQDITRAVAALSRLRQVGLGIIVDGMTLELLPYVRVDKLDHDYIKLLLPRDRVKLLASDARIRAVRKLPPDRLILGQCDHASAIKIGETLGVDLYQGWLLDKHDAPSAA